MIYCFDTSAINRLLDDPDRDPIVTALLATGSFRITAFNVLEAAKTPDEVRRAGLLFLMKHLSANKRPLDRPNTILVTCMKAHFNRSNRMKVNSDPNLEGLWMALNSPELVRQDAVDEATAFAARWDGDFDEIVVSDREKFQDALRLPGARPTTAAKTIRAFLAQDGFKDLVRAIYAAGTGSDLNDAQLENLLTEPYVCLYISAYLYALNRRSIQQEGYSKTRNASGLDLVQAVYLPMCDRFVTADRAQYRALRLLNKFNVKRKTLVLQYDAFRVRMFPFH